MTDKEIQPTEDKLLLIMQPLHLQSLLLQLLLPILHKLRN